MDTLPPIMQLPCGGRGAGRERKVTGRGPAGSVYVCLCVAVADTTHLGAEVEGDQIPVLGGRGAQGLEHTAGLGNQHTLVNRHDRSHLFERQHQLVAACPWHAAANQPSVAALRNDTDPLLVAKREQGRHVRRRAWKHNHRGPPRYPAHVLSRPVDRVLIRRLVHVVGPHDQTQVIDKRQRRGQPVSSNGDASAGGSGGRGAEDNSGTDHFF